MREQKVLINVNRITSNTGGVLLTLIDLNSIFDLKQG